MKSYVYIMFSKRNGTLYTGITTNLVRRVYEHKHKIGGEFAKKYGVDKLGFYEVFGDVKEAIVYEKKVKAGSRKKKLALIEETNPFWRDLYDEIVQG